MNVIVAIMDHARGVVRDGNIDAWERCEPALS